MIRRRVFEDSGEDPEGIGGYRCPGEGLCQRWDGAAGDYEQKTKACIGCPKECTPPFESRESGESRESESDAEIENLVDEIAYIIAWENAGIPTDWSVYSFEHQKLAVIWRETEQQVKRIHSIRLQAYLKGHFTSV